mgnify:CR=1 FL=1
MKNKTKVWQVAEEYWWLAPTKKEAIDGFKEFSIENDLTDDYDGFMDDKDVSFMNNKEMKETIYYPNNLDDPKRTFYEEYQDMLAKGKVNAIFAIGE